MRLKDLTLFEQVVLALSLIFLSMILVDPFMLERASALPKGVRNFFKAITDIGKSNWMLIPTGVAVALALVLHKRYGGWRNSAAYGLIASTIGFYGFKRDYSALVDREGNVLGPNCYDPDKVRSSHSAEYNKWFEEFRAKLRADAAARLKPDLDLDGQPPQASRGAGGNGWINGKGDDDHSFAGRAANVSAAE